MNDLGHASGTLPGFPATRRLRNHAYEADSNPWPERLRPWAASGPLRAPAVLTPGRCGPLLGQSTVMSELFATLRRIAGTTSTVLIEGETGTGKEVCAKAIHALSERADQEFGVCDLAGIPRTLVESELFGHVRGSFTGASGDRIGAFEQANGGTLLLDEIGELERDVQPRLLRVLEDRSLRPVGASGFRRVDVRIVAATNRDLAREVEEGRFRRDLYHRLAVVRIRMPALRERKEDIPLLTDSLLAGTGSRLAPAASALLQQHDWPGNVRELRNVIERGMALAGPGGVIEPDALGIEHAPSARTPAESAPAGPHPETYHDARRMVLDVWERRFVEDLVTLTRGNVSEAARLAGVGRAHLHRLIRKHSLRP